MPRIFLSHSSKDNREAAALHQWLGERRPMLPRQIFLDIHPEVGMEPGEWQRLLARKIASCELLLCLLTDNWDQSVECNWEFRTAVASNKLIVGARLQSTAGLGEVARYQRCELFPADDDQPTTSIDLGDGKPPVVFADAGLEMLLRYVTKKDFDWPPPEEPNRAPYRGWAPFERADAAVFFGRKAEIDAAVKELEGLQNKDRSKLFVILGPSGTGKSSFLRAGVLPRLERDTDRFLVMDVVRPGRDEALSGAAGLAKSINALRTRLGFDTPSLVDLKAHWIHDSLKVRELLVECQQQESDDEATPTLILPLDQAEELFSSEAGAEASALLVLASDLFTQSSTDEQGRQPLRLIVTATIRTDRYEAMQTAEQLAGIDAVVFTGLRPMPPNRFREIIEGPAVRSTEAGRRLDLDPLLVERLLADATANTTAGGDTLPLLSGTLHELYAVYGDDGRLDLDEYEQLGGIDRVVQTVIERNLVREEPARTAQLQALRDAFIPWLATVSDKDEKLRRIALWQDLPPTSLDLIDKLVDARILNKDKRSVGGEGATQQDVVEIALESFLRQWKELATWLDEEAPNLKAADELLRVAARWDSQHSESVLYRGELLDEAEALAASKTFGKQLVPAREFLLASRRRVTEEQEQQEKVLRRNAIRLRAVLAVAVVIALVAVGAFFTALKAQQEAERTAREATVQKLIADAQANLADSSHGSDVLALQELLAAKHLGQQNEALMLSALLNRISLLKVLEVPEPVLGVAYADDGHRLAMIQPVDGVRVWDTSAPDWMERIGDGGTHLDADGAELSSVAISRDGRVVVAGAADGTVRTWDLTQPDPVATVIPGRHDGTVTDVAVSRDGRIASVGVDGVIDVTGTHGDLTTVSTATVGGVIFAAAFNPRGDRLAVLSSDGMLRLYAVRDAGLMPGPMVRAHPDGEHGLDFSPDGRLLASGGADGKVGLWDADTLAPHSIPVLSGHTAAVTGVAFNADGSKLVSVSNDRTVRLWDVSTGRIIGDPMRGHGGLVLAVDVIADGNVIVTGGNEHTMRLWDGTYGQPTSTPLTKYTGPVTDVAISPSGDEVAASGTDGVVRVWNADTGAEIATAPKRAGVVASVAFSPAERLVASAASDGTVALWRPGGGAAPEFLDGGRPLTSVAFNADGEKLAAAGIDGQIIVWDLSSGRKTLLENKDNAVVYALAFDPTGDRLASGSVSGRLRMWQLVDGQQVWEATPILDLPDELKAKEFIVPGYPGVVVTVAFSPDGQRVASGSMGWSSASGTGYLQTWDSRDGSPRSAPMQVGNAAMDVAFAPGSDTDVVVAGFDPYEVQIWNTDEPSDARYRFTGHDGQVVSVAVSADGRRIVSGGNDGTVRVWPNVPAGAPEVAMCAKLTADMSEKVWGEKVSAELPWQPTCP